MSDIDTVLFEADSPRGLNMGGNVLDSRTRLQSILAKAGTNVGIASGWLRASSTWRSDSAVATSEVGLAAFVNSSSSSTR